MTTIGQAIDQSKLKITAEYVRDRYEYWNEKAFGGSMPKDVDFKVMKLPGTISGRTKVNVTYSTNVSVMKRIGADLSQYVRDRSRITMEISDKASVSYDMFDGILLHEMIHAALYAKGDVASGHGPRFLGLLKNIEAKAGRRIPVGHDFPKQAGDLPEEADFPAKEALMLVKRRRGNKSVFALVSAMAADKAAEFVRFMRERKIEWEVYRTKTPLASIYPVARDFDGFMRKGVTQREMEDGDLPKDAERIA